MSKTKLPMPVLAWGGKSGVGDRLKTALEELTLQVEGVAIEDCGLYVMEEQREVVAHELLRFFGKVEAHS